MHIISTCDQIASTSCRRRRNQHPEHLTYDSSLMVMVELFPKDKSYSTMERAAAFTVVCLWHELPRRCLPGAQYSLPFGYVTRKWGRRKVQTHEMCRSISTKARRGGKGLKDWRVIPSKWELLWLPFKRHIRSSKWPIYILYCRQSTDDQNYFPLRKIFNQQKMTENPHH